MAVLSHLRIFYQQKYVNKKVNKKTLKTTLLRTRRRIGDAKRIQNIIHFRMVKDSVGPETKRNLKEKEKIRNGETI